MIAENKRIEFWNFLTSEKNQPRPKGITVQRLAVIKPALLGFDELWSTVIGQHGADDRTAAEFYGSKEGKSVQSRADFWTIVGSFIRQSGNKSNQHAQKTNQGADRQREVNYGKRKRSNRT
jgi:hypothetical protein